MQTVLVDGKTYVLVPVDEYARLIERKAAPPTPPTPSAPAPPPTPTPPAMEGTDDTPALSAGGREENPGQKITLYFVCLEREWERIHRSGFSGERTVVFTATPDHRGVGWWGRRDELVCSVRIELPDEIAQQYADPGGRVYRVPAEIANQYMERPGRTKGAGG